jgi:hypothetical protein
MRGLGVLAVVAASFNVSCAARSHRIDFRPLADANRIEVHTSTNQLVTTMTGPGQVRVGVDFIQALESGWRDPLTGVRVPRVMLSFFKDDRFLGAFGIDDRYLMSHPPNAGFWSREAPAADLQRLIDRLGLKGAVGKQ